MPWPRPALVAGARRLRPALRAKGQARTPAGDIVIELDAAKAPKTVDNFLQYVKAGHYDGTVFHRVIDNFMIQGGGMTADLKEKPTRAPIPLESRNGLTMSAAAWPWHARATRIRPPRSSSST